MSNTTSQDAARARLLELRAEIESLSAAAADERKPVALDQQAVGRLSRMDALQSQAMAKAAHARRALELKRVDAALARVEDGEYGYCTRCGEAIEERRLALDPAAPFCAACAA